MDQLLSFIPLTLADIAPVILSYYVHGILAMLPSTFWIHVALLPDFQSRIARVELSVNA